MATITFLARGNSKQKEIYIRLSAGRKINHIANCLLSIEAYEYLANMQNVLRLASRYKTLRNSPLFDYLLIKQPQQIQQLELFNHTNTLKR